MLPFASASSLSSASLWAHVEADVEDELEGVQILLRLERNAEVDIGEQMSAAASASVICKPVAIDFGHTRTRSTPAADAGLGLRDLEHLDRDMYKRVLEGGYLAIMSRALPTNVDYHGQSAAFLEATNKFAILGRRVMFPERMMRDRVHAYWWYVCTFVDNECSFCLPVWSHALSTTRS